MPYIDHETGQVRQDEKGREIPDPKPLELPIGFKRPESLAEQVQRLVRNQVSQYAAMHGEETFEEADDFDIEDDVDPTTPYEVEFDPVLGKDITPADFQDPDKRERLRQAYLQAERNEIRAEAQKEAINEAYRRARLELAQRGVRGASPAPSSSEGPAGPSPAKPSSGSMPE